MRKWKVSYQEETLRELVRETNEALVCMMCGFSTLSVKTFIDHARSHRRERVMVF